MQQQTVIEGIVARMWQALAWMAAHPGAVVLGFALLVCVAMVMAAVILCRWERHEAQAGEQLLSACDPPKAPGHPSRRVG